MTEQIKQKFVTALKKAISKVKHRRYFETERGYQAALISKLDNELNGFEWEGAIIEQEYQKRMSVHGFNIRPDIIIHIPFDRNINSSRNEDNFVVFELKLNANKTSSLEDLANLSKMCSELNYPLGIYININGTSAYIDEYVGENKEKLMAFCVSLDESNEVIIS